MLAHSGKADEALAAFDKSNELARNPWALRSKAILLDLAGDQAKSADLLLEAVNLLAERNLAKEALAALQKAGRPDQVIDLYGRLPAAIQELGRLKVILIEALLDSGDADRAEEILSQDIVLTDVREGEVKLTDLWFRMMAMQEAKKTGVAYSEELLAKVKKEAVPPIHLDFRMH
jgi:tetratricopeptide (TPR) repeat protein